ncbi:MAG: ABC transporter ATP-binding protein [Blautia sp.]|jgi:NitT/TauT family transport system ATP-binding protein
MNPLLELRDVCLSYHSTYGETAALSHISFQVRQGEFLAIVGPSGCGKSTLLNMISGLITPEHGSILIDGMDQAHSTTNIGYMLQKDHLLEWRTIYKNVLLGLEIRKNLTPENIEYAKDLLHTYGLYEFKDKYPSQLSGGMRQRAALIRTLAVKPDILLLDEAFSALDYQTRLAVTEDVYHIIRQEHKTTIMVTHDIPEAISMSDRVIVLSSRPAVVKNIHTINFCDLQERTPLSCREHQDFRAYFNTIWKELDVHV